MTRQKLDSTAVSEKLAAVSSWEIDAGETALTKHFKFADFSEAFGFMARAALVAEKKTRSSPPNGRMSTALSMCA